MGAQPLITLGPWAVYAGLAMVALALPVLLLWLIGDRARGRKRCGRCWYDMSATTGLKCPECGREHSNEQRLFRTRRKGWVLGIGILLFAGGALLATAGYFEKPGRLAQLPLTVRVRLAGWHRFLGPVTLAELDASCGRDELTDDHVCYLMAIWLDSPQVLPKTTDSWAWICGYSGSWEYRSVPLPAAVHLLRRQPGVVARLEAMLVPSASISPRNRQIAIGMVSAMAARSDSAAACFADCLTSPVPLIADTARASVCDESARRILRPLAARMVEETRSSVWEVFRYCRARDYLAEEAAERYDNAEVRRAVLQAILKPTTMRYALSMLHDHPAPAEEIAAHIDWLLLAGEGEAPSGAYTELDDGVVFAIGTAGPVALKRVAAACADARPHVRFRAVSVFGGLARSAQSQPRLDLLGHLPSLIRAAGDSENAVAWSAVVAAERIMARDDSRSALSDPATRAAIAQSIVVTIDVLASRNGPESGNMLHLAEIASRLGAESAPVRARLLEIAASDDPRVRGLAKQAVQLIGKD